MNRRGRMVGLILAVLPLVSPGLAVQGWDDLPQANLPASLPLPMASSEEKQPGGPLVPGQAVVPIDLAGAIRLAGARDLDIAIARQLVCRSVADLQQARALWLPSLFLGPTWYRMDGKVQTISGQVINANRSSLFIGGLASGANSYPANPPGSGFPPLTGLASVLRFSDAIFIPRAARRELAASQADVRTASNNAMLAAAENYLDLLLASGVLAIEREATGNAGELARITGSFARTGEGLEADHQRILTELNRRKGGIEAAVGQLEVASTKLVQLLVLDPNQVLAPVEPAESIFRLLADETPLDEMIVQGLHQRPELARSQELVQATLMRLKQARLRPLIPSLAFSYAGGGFGGGQNGFFGNFGTRGDATVSLYWEVQNLGLTDLAIARRNLAENRAAILRLIKVENQIAADVAAAYKTRVAAARRMVQATPEVKKALESLRLNMLNIRRGAGLPGATRPIEVLQPIQALAQARTDYLHAVLDYNRSQYRLFHAIGWLSLASSPQPAATAPARPGVPAVSRAAPSPRG